LSNRLLVSKDSGQRTAPYPRDYTMINKSKVTQAILATSIVISKRCVRMVIITIASKSTPSRPRVGSWVFNVVGHHAQAKLSKALVWDCWRWFEHRQRGVEPCHARR